MRRFDPSLAQHMFEGMRAEYRRIQAQRRAEAQAMARQAQAQRDAEQAQYRAQHRYLEAQAQHRRLQQMADAYGQSIQFSLRDLRPSFQDEYVTIPSTSYEYWVNTEAVFSPNTNRIPEEYRPKHGCKCPTHDRGSGRACRKPGPKQ